MKKSRGGVSSTIAKKNYIKHLEQSKEEMCENHMQKNTNYWANPEWHG